MSNHLDNLINGAMSMVPVTNVQNPPFVEISTNSYDDSNVHNVYRLYHSAVDEWIMVIFNIVNDDTSRVTLNWEQALIFTRNLDVRDITVRNVANLGNVTIFTCFPHQRYYGEPCPADVNRAQRTVRRRATRMASRNASRNADRPQYPVWDQSSGA